MDKIPFPSKEDCFQELKRDHSFSKIPSCDYEKIINLAWNQGEQAAKSIYTKEHSFDFKTILQNYGLIIEEKNIDFISGNQRYYSDYVSGTSTITLYLKSIQSWATTKSIPLDDAINLILSHEFYHYLEMNQLGKTSRLYTVPIIKIGSLSLGKTGIAILSEIGAYAFTHTYFKQKDSSTN